MTIKGGGSKQACAVCKYQRRKCEKKCKLAKYFPADEPKTFQNVHRLFGVRSILRILGEVKDGKKKDVAMSSVIYESNMRAQYPVRGCWGRILQLQHQLQASIEELCHVKAQLAIFKEQFRNQTPSNSPSSELSIGMNNMGIYDEQPNHDHFNVEIDHHHQYYRDGDVKPFSNNKSDHLQNPNYYIPLPLGGIDNHDQYHNCPYLPSSSSSSSSQAMIPIDQLLQDQMGSNHTPPIHDDHHHVMSLFDHHHHHHDSRDSRFQSKGKDICDASSSSSTSVSNDFAEVVTKIKQKSGASSSKMLQFDPRQMTG